MTARLTQWIADLGPAGVFVLMAVDAVLPAGGALVMLFAGALAAGAIAGHEASSLPAAIAAGTLGYADYAAVVLLVLAGAGLLVRQRRSFTL